MYIRGVKKQRSKDSKTFYQYTLAQTLRLDGKVKQNAVLYLGSDPLLADKDNRKTVLEILKARIFNQDSLFPVNAPQHLVDLALSYFEKYPSEEELWQVYNTIREVEATFRCLKSDLQIRPVHHQKDERIESHIYLTILAYQLVNTIRHMLKEKGIHHDWNNITRIMGTQTIQTLVLPTDKKTIHLRKPAKPIKEVQEIYTATACVQTQKAIKKYVVYH